jgi:hypothetical protein
MAQKKRSVSQAPRKKVSNQYDEVDRNDQNSTDDEKEIELQKSPEEDQHWYETEERQIKRRSLNSSIESDQAIRCLNEFIVGIRHGLFAVVALNTVPHRTLCCGSCRLYQSV